MTANVQLNDPDDYKSRGELIADNVKLAAIVNNAVVALRAVHVAIYGLRIKWWWCLVPRGVREPIDRVLVDVGDRLDESGVVEMKAGEDGEVVVTTAKDGGVMVTSTSTIKDRCGAHAADCAVAINPRHECSCRRR